LVQIPARTLARIGKIEKSKQKLAISVIEEGNGFKENDLSMIIKKSPAPTKQQKLPELIQKVISNSNKIEDNDKIRNSKSIFIENIKFKQKIKVLEAQIIELKFNRPSQDTTKSIAKNMSAKKAR